MHFEATALGQQQGDGSCGICGMRISYLAQRNKMNWGWKLLCLFSDCLWGADLICWRGLNMCNGQEEKVTVEATLEE